MSWSESLSIDGWCLRPWRDSDAASLQRHADDVEVWRHMADVFPHPYTEEIAREWVTHGHVDFGGANVAIAFGDEAVGGCGIHPGQGPARCSVEIGYWIGRAYWGRGVRTRVVAALTARAFGLGGVTRVYGSVHADNPRSMRVLRGNGFEREGLLRQSVLKAGRAIDIELWARHPGVGGAPGAA